MSKSKVIKNLPAVIPPAIEYDEEELYSRFGKRPHKFKAEYIEIARQLCVEGWTDKEIAKFLGVNKNTLYEWMQIVPELAAVMKLGKEPADDRLERRAYEVAMGYTMTVREAVRVKEGNKETIQLVEKEVEIPPNPDMLRWLLKNRRPDAWRDKTEQVVSGEVVHLTADQARERLKAKLQELGMRQLGTGQPSAG